jgi:glucose dehydrogenase
MPHPREIRVRLSRLVLALILALVGAVWVGQGIGVIGGSAMSGSSFWAVVGLILLVVAVVIVVRERRAVPRS